MRTSQTRDSAAQSRRPYLLVKRAFDVLVCLLALPLALLIGIACALAIVLDSPGPPIFVQERTGYNGQRFRMYKFRTMVANAEELRQQLAHRTIVSAPDFKMLKDPRVTGVGNLLRRTSLDELPQILNVLRGHMSLVGPRPTSFDSSTYEPWHLRRLTVPPGITGLWQVEGRNQASFDERVRLDLRYIETMSLIRDLKILARTVRAVFRGEGA